MSRTLDLLCLFSISAIFFIDHVKARWTRRLVGEGIQGGTFAKEGEFPYHLSVEFGGKSFCGATILTDRFAITAAHCVTDKAGTFLARPLKVVAGVIDLKSQTRSKVVADVVKVYVPKEYNSKLIERGFEPYGDIAILELKNNLGIKLNKLGNVRLPEINEPNYEGKNAVISGFGFHQVWVAFNQFTQEYDEFYTERDYKLRFAQAKVTSNRDCQNKYGDILQLTKDRHMCAAVVQHDVNKPEGFCTGDSGGGLIYEGTIIGIASSSPTGCRENVVPGIYTRVSPYLGFINNVLNGKIDKNIRTITLVIDG